jgi:23S rRNA (guanine745-N1)-methyltransferase
MTPPGWTPFYLPDGAINALNRRAGTMETVARPPLACTARNCGLLLERRPRMMVCARRHAYDVARSGYINLLQPQDRRSLAAGDSKLAVAARARLLAAGVGCEVLEAFVQRAAALELPSSAVVVDLGSGTGDVLAALATRRPIDGVGIDLSPAAVEHAARRFSNHTWVVANADRRLPLLDCSVDLLLSMHGRRNPQECARVLTSSGFLLVAVPAQDDLIELRASVLGQSIPRDRAETVVTEHATWFVLVERATARERRRLDRESLHDLLRGTYRGARRSVASRVETLESLEVTIASEILLFARR